MIDRVQRLFSERSDRITFVLVVSASLAVFPLLFPRFTAGHSPPRLPWFVPTVEAFCLGGGFSIALLCLGRYLFRLEPYAFWLAVIFWLSALVNVIYLPAAQRFFPVLSESSGPFFYLLYLILLGPSLYFIWPHEAPKLNRKRNWLIVLTASSVGCLLVLAAILALSSNLPVVTIADKTSYLSRTLPYIYSFLYLGAIWLHAVEFKKTQEPLMGYYLGFLIASLWIFPGIIRTQEPYDASWYALHLVRASSYITMYFGLLTEYLELYREQRATLERMGITHHLNALVSGSLDLEEICQTLSREIQKLVPYDRLAINLLQKSQDDTQLYDVYSDESGLPAPVVPEGVSTKEGTASGWVADHRKPLICEDILAEERFLLTRERYQRVGLRSFIIVPLIAKGEVLGVLNLASLTPKMYGPKDPEIITPLAEILSLAVEHANLFDELRRRSAELEALVQINRHIASLVKRDQLLPLIAEAARRVLDVDGATFRLLERGFLVTAGHSGPGDLPISRRVLRPEESITGKVFSENRPLIIRSLKEDSTVIEQHRQVLLAAGYHSFLGVPLRAGDRAIGTITLFSKKEREFRPDEVNLITAFADQAAIAVENARLFEALGRSNAQLQAANKELEAFSYSVSHDLRAPLRSIDGFSQALLEDYADKLDKQAKDYLVRVRAGSQRMGQLIDDILNLSQVTRSEMRHETVNLSELASTVVAELQRAEPERQVIFVIPQDLTTNGDTRLLRIVLENLLGNAWKFTAKRSEARIELGVANNDGQAAYFVRDDGAGFDMAYAGKLFGAFQRLHATTEFRGSGIGLATVQRIIHRHGGRIWAEGQVDKGTTFYFTLPS